MRRRSQNVRIRGTRILLPCKNGSPACAPRSDFDSVDGVLGEAKPCSRRGDRGRTGTVDLESWGDATAVCCRIIIECRRERQAGLEPQRVSEIDLGLSQIMPWPVLTRRIDNRVGRETGGRRPAPELPSHETLGPNGTGAGYRVVVGGYCYGAGLVEDRRVEGSGADQPRPLPPLG